MGEDPPPSRICADPEGSGWGIRADCGEVHLPAFQTLDFLSSLGAIACPPHPHPYQVFPKAWNQMSHSSIWGQFCCSHFSSVP